MLQIELNDLPKHNKWIVELLENPSAKRTKNSQQIVREFGMEKWGPLLKKWKEKPCGIDTVRQWETSPKSVQAGLMDGLLKLISPAESFTKYVNLVESTLLENASPNLVEIGCGYGALIFELLERGRLGYQSIVGVEYTEQGVELAQNLATWHKYEVQFQQGDFHTISPSNSNIVPGADILTSFSFHYVQNSSLALDNIIKLRPRRVLQFEPIFQHYQAQTILGLLQQKYLEVNDYNFDLRMELTRLELEGRIHILEELPMVFGGNCLLPASVLIWQPASPII